MERRKGFLECVNVVDKQVVTLQLNCHNYVGDLNILKETLTPIVRLTSWEVLRAVDGEREGRRLQVDAGRPQQVGLHVVLVGARGSQVRAHVARTQDGHAHLQVSCRSKEDEVDVIKEKCEMNLWK